MIPLRLLKIKLMPSKKLYNRLKPLKKKKPLVWPYLAHLCLLWAAADSHNLLNKLLLLQLDRLLHSDLTEGVHRVLNTIRHHGTVVRLHTNLRRKKAAGQGHYGDAR